NLDVSNPTTHGNIIGQLDYDKVRKAMQDAQEYTKELIPKIAEEWKKKFGRYHGGLIEKYKCDGADYILLSMGAIGAESKVAIDNLQKSGVKIGLARVRIFRPFPTEEILKLAKQANLIVIDRNISIGNEGAVFTEVKSALYNKTDAKVTGFIAGLGGRDVTFQDIEIMCKRAIEGKVKGHEWYGFEGGAKVGN
ncbi:MAG: transketolase C-terminal domain-containing protein, partial [Candidatus Thermoplasmatota archaeon]|nr:transketolase C-terminal domain-containing protein [Candidatus Thermoplasmatota archaeon]